MTRIAPPKNPTWVAPLQLVNTMEHLAAKESNIGKDWTESLKECEY